MLHRYGKIHTVRSRNITNVHYLVALIVFYAFPVFLFLITYGHVFWTRHPKRYITRFWKCCTSRASRQLNLRNLSPTISKVYIFWKEISWGIQIWHQKWSRVKYKDFVTNLFVILRAKKLKVFKIHISSTCHPTFDSITDLNSSWNFLSENV